MWGTLEAKEKVIARSFQGWDVESDSYHEGALRRGLHSCSIWSGGPWIDRECMGLLTGGHPSHGQNAEVWSAPCVVV